MCKLIEDMRKEEREEGRSEERVANLRALVENGFSADKAFDMLKIPSEAREKLRFALAKNN